MEESRDLLLRYSRGENSGVPGPLQLRLLVGGPDEFGLHITLFHHLSWGFMCSAMASACASAKARPTSKSRT